MTTDVQKLLDSPYPAVVNAATRAIEIHQRYMNHQVSEQEYNDLIDDIVRLDRIDQAMFTEKTFMIIKKAYGVILALKTLTSIL